MPFDPPQGPDDEAEPREALRLVHHHPGRLRVRAGVFQVRHGAARPELEHALSKLRATPGVTRIAHSPFTGSLVIEYQTGRVEPGALVAAVATAAGLEGVVDEETVRRRDSNAAVGLVRAMSQMNRVARELSGGRADMRLLAPGALFVGAMISLFRQPIMPRWDNLLYWSYTVFKDLNQHAIEEAAAAADEEDLEEIGGKP